MNKEYELTTESWIELNDLLGEIIGYLTFLEEEGLA